MIIKKRSQEDLSIIFFMEDKKSDFMYNYVLGIVPDDDSTSDDKRYQMHKKLPNESTVSDRQCKVISETEKSNE